MLRLRAFLDDWGVHGGVTLLIMGVGLDFGGWWLGELARSMHTTPGISAPGVFLLVAVGAVLALGSGIVATVAGLFVTSLTYVPRRDT